MLKLSEKDAEIKLLTNDAFFWLKDEEEPIDEANLEEAYELLELYPNGFKLLDNFTYEDDDTIKCILVPYIEVPDEDWDGEVSLVNQAPIKFKRVGLTGIKYLWLNENTHKVIAEGETELSFTAANKPYFITKCGSQIHLWGKNVFYF